MTRPALSDLVERIAAMARTRQRVLVGLTGAPGAGKSTLAAALAGALPPALRPAVVPMDGFHLADAALAELGLIGRKGAPETFDADGYVALLGRLRQPGQRPVFAPGFERTLEQPLAAAVVVPPQARVVLTEGNYLLLDSSPWRQVRDLLDEVWFVQADEALRADRLRERHLTYGKSPEATDAWIAAVDAPNADLVAATRGRADLLVLRDALD